MIQKYNFKRGELIEAIHSMSRDDLDLVIEAVKMRRTYLHKQNAREMQIGDYVEFDGKNGRPLKGNVVKKAIKYIIIDCDNGQSWRVPAGALRKVA